MLVPISDIKINPGRREVLPEDVKDLADSIKELSLLNPITIDQNHTLIAGRHRLEAAKSLGWTEIECHISDLQGLKAELAEIDENFVRRNLSTIEYGDLLLRRKEIFEILHPESIARNICGHISNYKSSSDKMSLEDSSFAQDTADKLGISKRTVERQIQTAKNLSPVAKEIIRDSDAKVTKTDALKLSRLEPDQQEQAATQLVAGEIKSVDEYKKPYSLGDKVYATLEESIADMKNTEKDTTYTPDMLLISIDGMVQEFHRNFTWYDEEICMAVFPQVSEEQLVFIKEQFASVTAALDGLVERIERSRHDET